jgi:signal transduction histidine kinase
MDDDAKASATLGFRNSVDESRLIDALVAEIARGLIRVTVGDLDAEINLWLERIGVQLGLDRSTIGEINPATGIANFIHGWAREPYRVISRPLDASALLPWTVERMLASETVVMTNPDKLPKEAAVDRESFLRYGPKSNVIVPIRIGGAVIGGMSFASLREERGWPVETVRGFQAIAEIFGFGLERKRAVAEILRLQNELTYVSRVTMMGELAASMAHELNQPLGAILSNAEALEAMLASKKPNLDEIRAGISDIIQDDNRARETIQRVWMLFRRGEVTKSRIDIAELLSGIGRMVRTDALMRNVCLNIEARQPLPPVLAEPVQLQQAIINLVLNAFDAVASIEDGPREVRVEASAGAANDDVEVVVRDTGKGIARAAISRIFEPFFTTKSNGMGMGLAIAKSIIEAHGGKLSVALNSDRGTSFTIRLPSASEGGS